MTDNDIIKALECCSKDDADCEKCPANGICDNDDFCVTGAILDLINRQQAEIVAKEMEYNDMLEQCKSVEKHLVKAQAEIEQLKGIGFANKLFFERIRIDAVKEFAEKVLLYIPNIEGETTMKCVEEAIKQTLKEMVGDNQ